MDGRRRPRISLDRLRGFCVAARHLSFTRAAQELFVTQPAISREVRTLEEELGTPLFRRVNRTLQLTPAGQELYQSAEEALGLIDQAIDRVGLRGRTLAVTTTTSLASLWLAPRLAQFTGEHPGIDVRLAAINDMANLNLEREHLDIAIQFVPPGWSIPAGEQLVDYETFPVCSPALARDHSRPLASPADLSHHILLDFERVAFGRVWSDWERWFRGMKLRPVKPFGRLQFSHYDQVIQAAVAGSGIAIGKQPHLDRYLRNGDLCAPLGPEWTARLGTFWIVTAPRAAGSKPAAAFVAWVRGQIRDAGKAGKRAIGRARRDR